MEKGLKDIFNRYSCRNFEDKPIEKSDEQVITSGGKKPIPVVHHNDSFDFIGEDEPDPSLSEKEPEVLFVKRGNFDE